MLTYDSISLRVLKPPGGGSSLFFGGDDDDMAPRRVKNHNSSNLPLGDVVETGDQKVSRADSIDGTNTPSQGSVSNGSPTNSEPTTPRSGKSSFEPCPSSVA